MGCFQTLQATSDLQSDGTDEVDPVIRALQADVFKGYRYTVAEIGVSCVLSYGNNKDLSNVLNVVKVSSKNEFWQMHHEVSSQVCLLTSAGKFHLQRCQR